MNLKTYCNGDTVQYNFDKESRPWRMGITNGTTPVRWYGYQWNPGNQILSITNDSTNLTLYAYDAAGQLTNEVTSTLTNGWVYDEAGNWLNAGADSKWVYNLDNEITGRLPLAASNATNITVTGEVEPGPQSNKWYQSVARLRETTVAVNTKDGTFSIPDVAVYPATPPPKPAPSSGPTGPWNTSATTAMGT
jgi:YD repeat-containing protein